MSSISKQVQRVRVKLMLSHAFLSTIMLSTPFYEDESVGTACTDMKCIRYNPKFFDPLPDTQVLGVIVHELLHITFFHGIRRGNRDNTLWNVACDYAINLILVNWGFELPEGGLLDRKFDGMSAEQIYDALMRETEAERERRREGLAGSSTGEDLVEPTQNPSEARDIEGKIKQAVAAAATTARLAGKMSADIEAIINEALGGRVPWQALLREYMTASTADDESWTRRNRRFSDVVLPSRYSASMGRMVVIGDTSGSVSDEELNMAGAEIACIAETMKPEAIHVLWADTTVKREEVIEAGDMVELHPLGRGGTDMRVPLKRAAELEPAVTVLITDGETPWPNAEPDYPLIVVCTTNAPCPFGQVVRMVG